MMHLLPRSDSKCLVEPEHSSFADHRDPLRRTYAPAVSPQNCVSSQPYTDMASSFFSTCLWTASARSHIRRGTDLSSISSSIEPLVTYLHTLTARFWP